MGDVDYNKPNDRIYVENQLYPRRVRMNIIINN